MSKQADTICFNIFFEFIDFQKKGLPYTFEKCFDFSWES